MKASKGSTTSFAVDSNTDPNNLSTFQSNTTVGIDTSVSSKESTTSFTTNQSTDANDLRDRHSLGMIQ